MAGLDVVRSCQYPNSGPQLGGTSLSATAMGTRRFIVSGGGPITWALISGQDGHSSARAPVRGDHRDTYTQCGASAGFRLQHKYRGPSKWGQARGPLAKSSRCSGANTGGGGANGPIGCTRELKGWAGQVWLALAAAGGPMRE